LTLTNKEIIGVYQKYQKWYLNFFFSAIQKTNKIFPSAHFASKPTTRTFLKINYIPKHFMTLIGQ